MNRGVIEKGAQMLGVELDVLMADVIMGMRTVAEDIGLGHGHPADAPANNPKPEAEPH